jgi:hypothetical protein
MNKDLEPVFEAETATMQKVIELRSRGYKPHEIQSQTSVPPAQQRAIYEEFMEYASNDFQTQKRAKAIVAELDVQYNYIIRQLEQILEEIEESVEPDLKLKKETLKELANVNKMRVDQLQKAGILNSEAIGSEIAAMQKEHDAIIGLLKKVNKELNKPEFRVIKKMIADGIADIRGEVIDV